MKMHRFERCQSTERQWGGGRLLREAPPGAWDSFGHKSDGFHGGPSICVPVSADKNPTEINYGINKVNSRNFRRMLCSAVLLL